MRFSYDAETDSLYIHLAETPGADAIALNSDVVADLDHNGHLVGIDIQQASLHIDLNTIDLGNLPVAHLRWNKVDEAA